MFVGTFETNKSFSTNPAMALAKGSSAAGNLKIGDVVLLYYSAEQRVVTESAEKSGFILADLSG